MKKCKSTGFSPQAPAEALEELEKLYASLDERLSVLAFECRMDGDCCRFEQSGHSLFLTFLEACCFFESDSLVAGSADERSPDKVCPYLDHNRCTHRRRRSLGCRVFACDTGADEGTTAIYEEYHQEIQRLHHRYGIPYQYKSLGAWALEFAC